MGTNGSNVLGGLVFGTGDISFCDFLRFLLVRFVLFELRPLAYSPFFLLDIERTKPIKDDR